MRRRIIVGISGSSGVIHGARLLERLRELNTHEIHLVVSETADRTLAIETGRRAEDLRALCDVWHRNDNLAASIASGIAASSTPVTACTASAGGVAEAATVTV